MGFTNLGRLVAWVTNSCSGLPNLCGFSEWNLHHVLARILKFVLDFWNICGLLLKSFGHRCWGVLICIKSIVLAHTFLCICGLPGEL